MGFKKEILTLLYKEDEPIDVYYEIITRSNYSDCFAVLTQLEIDGLITRTTNGLLGKSNICLITEKGRIYVQDNYKEFTQIEKKPPSHNDLKKWFLKNIDKKKLLTSLLATAIVALIAFILRYLFK